MAKRPEDFRRSGDIGGVLLAHKMSGTKGREVLEALLSNPDLPRDVLFRLAEYFPQLRHYALQRNKFSLREAIRGGYWELIAAAAEKGAAEEETGLLLPDASDVAVELLKAGAYYQLGRLGKISGEAYAAVLTAIEGTEGYLPAYMQGLALVDNDGEILYRIVEEEMYWQDSWEQAEFRDTLGMIVAQLCEKRGAGVLLDIWGRHYYDIMRDILDDRPAEKEQLLEFDEGIRKVLRFFEAFCPSFADIAPKDFRALMRKLSE